MIRLCDDSGSSSSGDEEVSRRVRPLGLEPLTSRCVKFSILEVTRGPTDHLCFVTIDDFA